MGGEGVEQGLEGWVRPPSLPPCPILVYKELCMVGHLSDDC